MKAPRVFGWVWFRSHAHLCGQEDDSHGRGRGEMSWFRPGTGCIPKAEGKRMLPAEEYRRRAPKRKRLPLTCKLQCIYWTVLTYTCFHFVKGFSIFDRGHVKCRIMELAGQSRFPPSGQKVTVSVSKPSLSASTWIPLGILCLLLHKAVYFIKIWLYANGC